MRNAITSYYALAQRDPQSAYDLTGPTLRSVESREDFIAFWNRFDSVSLGPVSVPEGSLVASASVTFVEGGTQLPVEQHTITLIPGSDGRLLVDSDRAG